MVLRNIIYRTFQQRMAVAPNAELDGIAVTLQSTPDARWEIAGYTDSRGTPMGNRRLSQRRAMAVMQYLIRKGVPSTSLVATGFGAQNPVASNVTLAGRRQNQRIEIRRLP
jgi:OOP family OmpA-OmpF porin